MGGQQKPEVTQAPTKSPQQMQFLDSLLNFMSQATAGQTIGGGYGGPGQANYSPIAVGQGKGGGAPTGGPRGRGGQGSPLDKMLTEPFVGPWREGLTSNFKRR